MITVTLVQEDSTRLTNLDVDDISEVIRKPESLLWVNVRAPTEDDFATALAPTRYDSESRVVIAEPRELGCEWRMVVAGDEVIAASQYADGGVKSVALGCPDDALAFAREVLSAVRWRPDDIFMLDVCESDAGLRLVELNSFSCSWLYACDFAAVVRVASELAAHGVSRV